VSPAEFEPSIPASERLQNYAEDRAATRIGIQSQLHTSNLNSTLFDIFIHMINSVTAGMLTYASDNTTLNSVKMSLVL